MVSSNKVSQRLQAMRAAPVGQDKKISGKEKVLSHPKKERKMLLRQVLMQPLWLALHPT